jgi:hypothetical protein
MKACYGGTGVMERSCAVAQGKDTNKKMWAAAVKTLPNFQGDGSWGGMAGLCVFYQKSAPALAWRG